MTWVTLLPLIILLSNPDTAPLAVLGALIGVALIGVFVLLSFFKKAIDKRWIIERRRPEAHGPPYDHFCFTLGRIREKIVRGERLSPLDVMAASITNSFGVSVRDVLKAERLQ